MRDDIIKHLAKSGYTMDLREAFSFYLGSVQVALRDRGGDLMAVADPRRDGSAESA